MMDHAYAVIMAGGKGERFWPLSTANNPKQFISLFGDTPLLGHAVNRLEGLIPPERVIVITSANLCEATRQAAPDLPPENVIGEPFGRDTAAACALAEALVRQRDPQGVFCILTADQLMEGLDVYRQTLADALKLAARETVIVTIGIEPSYPATGFGYVEAGDAVPVDAPTQFHKAVRFVEKPDQSTAEQYVAGGRHFWNSGMFIWSCDTVQDALTRFQPALKAMADRMTAVAGTDAFDAALEAEYSRLEKISVDYAIMEHAENIVMARGRFGWDDVGAWPAIANHFAADAEGNVVIGDVESVDAQDNVVVSEGRLTALLGVRDLVVVQAPNATLICPRERAQDVKAMVRLVAQRADKDLYL